MRALRIFSLVIGAAIVAVAQSSTPAPPSDKAQWLERANLITASIQEDAKDLAPSLRLILLGKLGEVWRNVDPQRSKAWLSDSLTAITSPPEQESAEDRKTRMQVAYNLLPDLNESDQAAADQLLDYLVADAKQKIAANARGPGFTSEVMALGNALRAVISNPDQPRDPQRIYDIAQRALDLRDGNSIIPAYQALRMADPVRADQFAREALKIAGMNYDSFLFFALAQVAAPFPGLPVQLKAPEELRAEILKVLAAGMLRPPVGPADKQNICELATPVTMAMKAFPPAQAVQLRVAVDNCKAANADLRDNISAMDIHSREGTPSECWARPTKRTMRSRGHR